MQSTPFMRIFLSILIAFFLTLLPVPKDWQWLQPQWLMLVILFWVLAYPHRIGVLTAWTIGLMLDALGAGVLGLHALGMAVVAHFAYLLHLRIKSFPIWQRGLVIFILLGLYQTIIRLIPSILGYPTPEGLLYYVPTLTSLMLWPLLSGLLSAGLKLSRYN